jgi:hypothetical protein
MFDGRPRTSCAGQIVTRTKGGWTNCQGILQNGDPDEATKNWTERWNLLSKGIFEGQNYNNNKINLKTVAL